MVTWIVLGVLVLVVGLAAWFTRHRSFDRDAWNSDSGDGTLGTWRGGGCAGGCGGGGN
jgi:hypothetical protein